MSGSQPPHRQQKLATDDDPFAFPAFTRARQVRAELVTSILRRGRPVPDEAFDEIYPDAVRRLSAAHWTPVRICARVIELLALPAGARLLDIGAGVGKFCIVAAALSRARVRGVEREPEFAKAAREAARRLGVEVEFIDGEFDTQRIEEVDAAYLFNPFTEAIPLPGIAMTPPANGFAERAAADVAAAERFLRGARIGMRLVTYYGFGGTVPHDYRRLAKEWWEGGVLDLWEKREPESHADDASAHRDDGLA
jgi:predicted RNA methylase